MDDNYAQDPLRGCVGFGFYLLILAVYWFLQTAYVLDRNISRKDGKLRRWRFSCKSDNSRGTATGGSSGSPASTVDSGGLAVDRTPTCPAFWCVRAQRWPLEASFRLLLSLVAASSELGISGLNGGFTAENTRDLERSTVYGILCVSGLIDLLCHFRLLYPTGSGHFVMSVGFAVQAYFYYSPELEDVLIAGAIFCLAVATLIELWWDRTPTSRLPRVYFALVTSSWLVHIGFRQLSSAERWEESDSSGGSTVAPSRNEPNSKWTALLFTWHLGAAVLIMLAMAAIIKCAKIVYNRANLNQNSFISNCCPCSSAEDGAFRASPTDDLEETEPLAMQP